MRDFVIVTITAVCLLGCPHKPAGDQYDAEVQIDSETLVDAEILADAEVQVDALIVEDAHVEQDVPIIADAAVEDAAVQQDATIPVNAEVTYDLEGAMYNIWGGVPSIVTTAFLRAVNMDSDLTRVKWTFVNIDNTNVADASMLLDSTPLAQQNAVWLTPTELEFTTNIQLTQGVTSYLALRVKTRNGSCTQTIAADILLDTDLEGSAGPTHPTVFTENSWSQVPSPVGVNNIWIQLASNNPSSLVPSPNTSMMIYEIITSYDASVRFSPMHISVVPFSEIIWFANVSNNHYMGSQINVMPIVICNGNTCDLDFHTNFNIMGNCQVNAFEVEADINGPLNDPTVAYMSIDLAEWEIVDINSGSLMPPEYQANAINGPFLAYP